MKYRKQWIEALRGYGAIAVLNCHVIPALIPDWKKTIIGKIIEFSPVGILISGGIPIAFFLVLTGFGMANKASTITIRKVPLEVIKRYFRLMLMTFMCCLFVSILIRHGFYAQSFTVRPEVSIVRWMDSSKNIQSALYDAAYRVFFKGASALIGPFWMLRWEFFGAVLAMLAMLLLKKVQPMTQLGVIMIVTALFLCLNWLYCFMVLGGMAITVILEVVNSKLNIKEFGQKHCKKLIIVGILLLWVCKYYVYTPFQQIRSYEYLAASAWCLILLGGNILEETQNVHAVVLGDKCMQFLGKNSFAIYGLHMPVMLTVGAYLLWQVKEVYSIKHAIVIYLVIVVSTIIIASAFTWLYRYILRKVENLLRRCKYHGV